MLASGEGAEPAAERAGWHGWRLESRSPLNNSKKTALISFVGGFAAILMLGLATEHGGQVLLMAPFGASTVLLFAAWDAPLSQPRSLIFGHLLASIIALAMLTLLGGSTFVMALAFGTAMGAMVLTKTTHPPAGADVVVIFLTSAGWDFLAFPLLAGALLLFAAALALNRLAFKRDYPKFWY